MSLLCKSIALSLTLILSTSSISPVLASDINATEIIEEREELIPVADKSEATNETSEEETVKESTEETKEENPSEMITENRSEMTVDNNKEKSSEAITESITDNLPSMEKDENTEPETVSDIITVPETELEAKLEEMQASEPKTSEDRTFTLTVNTFCDNKPSGGGEYKIIPYTEGESSSIYGGNFGGLIQEILH